MHIAVFLAGFTAILGRLITLNEGMIVWYRLLFTAITMWVLFGLMKKIKKLPLSKIISIGAVGFIAALHWVTFYGSIKYSNVSVALICFSSISFFTALCEPLILKKKLNRTELLLRIITLMGIYVIFHFDTQYKTGIVMGIISALLGALFPIYNREFLKTINVETVLVWQQTVAFAAVSLFLPLYLYYFPVPHFLPGKWDFLWLLFLSWICSVWAFQLSSHALKWLSAFTVNLTFNLEPLYGIILAFILFKENQFLSKWFYVGFAIIAIALIVHIILVIKEQRKTRLDGAIGVS